MQLPKRLILLLVSLALMCFIPSIGFTQDSTSQTPVNAAQTPGTSDTSDTPAPQSPSNEDLELKALSLADQGKHEEAKDIAQRISDPQKKEETTRIIKTSEANQNFLGISFGVGLSLTIDLGKKDRVTSATTDANGFVRVEKRENMPARLMLETHYFFPWSSLTEKNKERREVGIGPFIAVQPGNGQIIDAIGLGAMIGFRRSGSTVSGQSFNIGIGIVIDPSVKVLGDEFEENRKAPTDEDGDVLPVRLEERDQAGVLIIGAFAW